VSTNGKSRPTDADGQVTSRSVALGLALKVQLLWWSKGRRPGLGLGEIDLRIGAAPGPREEVRGVPRGDLGRALDAASIFSRPVADQGYCRAQTRFG
jgi:hypothetical protein